MKPLSKSALKRLAAGKLPLPTEDDTQTAIVQGLVMHGYSVRIASRRAKRCPNCGTYSHKGDGASRGIGDLLARRKSWPAGVAVNLEVKREGAPIKYSSEEQKIAALVAEIVVVRTLEESLAACREFEAVLM